MAAKYGRGFTTLNAKFGNYYRNWLILHGKKMVKKLLYSLGILTL